MLLGKIASVTSTLSFSFERENFGAIPHLEKYLIPQFSRRMMKASFGKFKVMLFDSDNMTVSCLIYGYLRSHGEFSMKTART